MGFFFVNFPATQTLSVPQRIEIRGALRSLENFLRYRFNEQKKLSLIEVKVYGYAVPCLKEILIQDINWKNYPSLWWNDSLNLRKISKYVAEKAFIWSEALKNDEAKLVSLERQCALLERVVDKYNEKKAKQDPLQNPISFINPFKKVLRVVTSYPAVYGQTEKTEIIQDISYDRLVSSDELRRRVQEAISAPVTLLASGIHSLKSNQKIEFSLITPPQDLFRQMTQQPEFLFDPSDDNYRESHQIVKVAYEDPDALVFSALIFKAGQDQAIPKVYESGYSVGKIAGFREAIEKVKIAFSGNLPDAQSRV